jgi:hypothetical protein
MRTAPQGAAADRPPRSTPHSYLQDQKSRLPRQALLRLIAQTFNQLKIKKIRGFSIYPNSFGS